MEVKRTELNEHASTITEILRIVCDVSKPRPIVKSQDEGPVIVVKIGYVPPPVCRQVTGDLGNYEFALRLWLGDDKGPQYWISLHERWGLKGKHVLHFQQCGLRLYFGHENEEPIQLLRLEWVAPTRSPGGEAIYAGAHAGHPHWHIDRAVLGCEDYSQSLTLPEASGTQPELFSRTTAASREPTGRTAYDCSGLHLPAHSGWMESHWDGRKIPGPHQNEPTSLKALGNWWNGALRYFVSELKSK